MCHDVAALGNHTIATSTRCAVAQQSIVTLGCIVNPGIEIAKHTDIDSTEEVKEVLREIVVSLVGISLALIPIDKKFRHPQFLTFGSKVLIGRAYTCILMTTINIEARKHIGIIQDTGVIIGRSH